MKIQIKAKKLLQKYVINNIQYKILAALFAFVLWLVILNITDPEYSRNIGGITVKIENEQMVLDGTHVYTITSGATTSITITGKRSIISSLSANDFLVKANFAELSITNAVPISVELVRSKARYASQISIVPKDTSMIINLEEMKSKQIPVEIQYIGENKNHMVIDEANLSPKKVTISAAASIVDSAEKAVVSTGYSDIEEEQKLLLTPVVYNTNGGVIKLAGETSIDDMEIVAQFKISYEKQVPVIFTLSGEAAPGFTCSGFELSQDTITLKGPKEQIESLESITIDGEVSVAGAEKDFDQEVDVTPYLPEGITVYGESPTVIVTVKIEEKEEN